MMKLEGSLSFNTRKHGSQAIRLLVLLIILASGYIHGQTLTLKQFLRSSLDDSYYQSFNLQSDFLNDKSSYSLPWVNQVQFRYQDNEFKDYKNRYGMRVDAANPWQISSNKKYFQGFKTLKAIEQKMVLKEILRDRYDKVVEFWMASALADLTLKQKEIRVQIGYALGQKAGSAGFDADQYLNAQLDIISKEADWQEANFERDVAKAKIMEAVGATSFDLPIGNLVDVDQINQLIQTEIQSPNPTELELLNQRVTLSNLKMKLEKSNFDIGYLQGLYSTDRRLLGQNKLGIALGITIPIVNTNKENIAREKLAVLERQGKLDQFQSEEKSKRLNSALYLKLQLSRYQKLDSLITAVKIRGLNLLTGLSSNYDPIVELKYREKQLQFDVLKIKIKKEILLQYNSFLDYAGKLHDRPLLNYLSKDLERIEE